MEASSGYSIPEDKAVECGSEVGTEEGARGDEHVPAAEEEAEGSGWDGRDKGSTVEDTKLKAG